MSKPIIQTKNLRVTYGLGKSNEFKILKGVNLEIYPEEFIILFGPSGCGKSTLLYSLSGLERGTQGEIFINGREMSSMKPKEVEKLHQKRIGMIFQEFYLIPSLSVLSNVILPQIAIGGDRKYRKNKAIELLKRFGVGGQYKKLPSELSGGQKQRVAICRSIMNDPDIVFADEPVGNLDSKSSDEVMDLLKDLNKTQKKTIVLVTHNPAHLSYAHRVFYIKDGNIIKIDVNKAINKQVVIVKDDVASVSISKEYELIARCFSSMKNMGTLMLPFKAKQIVSNVLTGMTTEDVERIEKKVEYILKSGVTGNETFVRDFLDLSDGGLALDSRTALKIGDKINDIVREVKLLEEKDKEVALDPHHDIAEEALVARQYLFDSFDIKLEDDQVLELIDDTIKMRMKNVVDSQFVQKKLNTSVKNGGAGFDIRKAKRIAKRLDLLILGKMK